jgi:L-ascorbate metabolism protein UlaG (beta-lactamase superfamily)
VTIHVDPNGVPATEEPADFILLTHPHFDVFSERDIERVRKPDTVIIAPSSMKKLVPGGDHYMSPGDALQIGGVDILATPAYNLSRRYHPKSTGWLGYLFAVDGITYYHAGHTSRIPAMSGIRCDVAFLPCDGKYSMGPTEMLRAAEACQARVVVPIHCGAVPGGRAELERVRSSFPGEVLLLEPATPLPPRH